MRERKGKIINGLASLRAIVVLDEGSFRKTNDSGVKVAALPLMSFSRSNTTKA
jgi:hypothetical protein